MVCNDDKKMKQTEERKENNLEKLGLFYGNGNEDFWCSVGQINWLVSYLDQKKKKPAF